MFLPTVDGLQRTFFSPDLIQLPLRLGCLHFRNENCLLVYYIKVADYFNLYSSVYPCCKKVRSIIGCGLGGLIGAGC